MSIAKYLAKLAQGVDATGQLSNTKISGGYDLTPTITGIAYPGDDTAADPAGGQTITLTGTNFASGAKVIVNGVTASVVTVVSSTQITFTTSAVATGSYILYVVNTNGSTAIAAPGIQYSTMPAFSTAAGTLGTLYETVAVTVPVAATSDSAITYSLFSGTLPPGITINTSTGTISGTSSLTAASTTYTFTIRATDTQLQDGYRQFSLTINPDVVTWSSPANASTIIAYQNTNTAVPLLATSALGSTIIYSSSNLPNGLAISSGNITGAPTGTGSASSTVTATTLVTSRTATTTFNWTILIAGDTYWKNTTLLLPGNSTADASLSDYLILNNQVIPIGDTRSTAFNPYQAGYYSNQFNGSGDYLTIPHNTQLNLSSGDFTIEAWVYWTGANTAAVIIDKDGVSGSAVPQYHLSVTSSKILFSVGTGNGTSYHQPITPVSTTFPINTWTHVAGVKSGTTLTIYQNGVNVISATQTGTMTDGAKVVYIGYETGQSANSYWAGNISNVRIVKGTAVYTANFTPATAPLTAIAGTTLLTSRSARFTDAGPNNFAITTSGTPSVQQFSPFGVPTTATTNNLYSTYIGTSDGRLTVPAGTAFAYGTSDFTAEGWFLLPTMTQAGSPLLFSQSVSGTNYFCLFIESSAGVATGKVLFAGNASGGGSQIYSGSNLFTAGTWNHFAVCRVNGTVTVYLNGVGGTPTANATNFTDVTYVPTIGGYTHGSGTNDLKGFISNLRIVKGLAVYTGNFTPSTSQLTATQSSGTNIAAITGTSTSLLTCQNSTFRDNSTNAFIVSSATGAYPIAQSPFTQTTTAVSLNSVGSTYFDGTGDAAYIAGDGNVVNFGTNNYTVEAWVWCATGSCIMDTCPSGTVYPTNRIQLNVNTDGSCSYVTYQGNQTLISTAAGLALPRQWHHIALVKYNNQTKIYINGVQGGSTYADTLTMPSQGNRPWINGNGYDGSAGGVCYISNYRISKSAIYTATFTPPTAPLTVVNGTQALFYQTSQAPNNSQFVDNSSAANAITRFGNTTQGTFAPYGDNWSNYFPTASINTSSSGLIAGTNTFTLEFWIFPTAGTADDTIVDTRTSNGVDATAWLVGLTGLSTGDGVLKWLLNGTGNASLGGTVPKNQWSHIAVTRNSSNVITGYVNGVATGTTQTDSRNLTNTNFLVGGNVTTPTGTWYLSNVRWVVGSVVYSSTFTPSTTPLTAITNTKLLTCQSNRYVDNSSNGYTFTTTGSPSVQRFSPFGPVIQTPQTYSGYFDGFSGFQTPASSFTTLIGASTLTSTATFTLECWIYQTQRQTWSTYPCMMGEMQLQGGATGWTFGPTNAGNLQFFWYDGANKAATGNTVIPLNTWTHIAVSISNGAIKLFVNGNQETISGTSTLTTLSTSQGYLAFGMVNSGGASTGYYGYISNFRIAKTAVYTTTFTPSTTPLTAIANTSLLTCQSPTFIDNSTNAFAITAVGNSTPRAFNQFGYTLNQGQSYTPALYGASAYFDGTGDYLTIANNPALQINSGGTASLNRPFTIEGWVYTTSTALQQFYVYAEPTVSTGSNVAIYLGYTGNGTVDVGLYNLGTALAITAGSVPINCWNHIAFVNDTTNFIAYINGVRVGSVATTGNNINNSTTMTGRISYYTAAAIRPITGYISDFKMSRNAVYIGNFVPPQAPLTATAGTTLLLNMDKGALVDYTKSVDLETVGDAKINNESAYNGGYYSNYFDGSGDSFSSPAGLNTAMGNGFAGNILSFECWIYPTNFNFGANGQILIGTYAAVSANGRWYIALDKTANATTNFNFGWTTGTASQTGVTTTVLPITQNQWNHIAVTVDATTASSSTIRLFANGILLNTFTAQDLSSQTAYYQPAFIGGCGSTTYTSEFQGYISNFRILKGSLAYTGNYTVPTVPLTAITNTALLICQSNTFKDNSTNNFALTRNGDISVRSLNPFQRNTNTSMYFDGTGDYLFVPGVLQFQNFAFGTGDFTIECWLYQIAFSADKVIAASVATWSTSVNFYLGTRAGTPNILIFRGGDSVPISLNGNTDITTNTWTHIAVSRASGVTRMFVGGVLQTATHTGSVNISATVNTTGIGAQNNGSEPMNGYIEDLRFTRGYARYIANFTPPTSKLLTK